VESSSVSLPPTCIATASLCARRIGLDGLDGLTARNNGDDLLLANGVDELDELAARNDGDDVLLADVCLMSDLRRVVAMLLRDGDNRLTTPANVELSWLGLMSGNADRDKTADDNRLTLPVQVYIQRERWVGLHKLAT